MTKKFLKLQIMWNIIKGDELSAIAIIAIKMGWTVQIGRDDGDAELLSSFSLMNPDMSDDLTRLFSDDYELVKKKSV